METILLLLLLSIVTGYTGLDYAASGHGLGGKCMCHTVDGREIFLIPFDLAFYDGKLTRWYENGQKKSEQNFKDGELDGKVTYWNKDGAINREEYYENGVLVG